jgi:OOP family OmpA-OmpF porin
MFNAGASTAAIVAPGVATSSVPAVAVSSSAAATPKLTKAEKFTVPFPSAKALQTKEGKDRLDEIAAMALRYPESRVIVEGHTDSSGPKAVNKKLSTERAQAVGDYLESKGVARNRLTVSGYGDERPLEDGSNATPEGRLKNRRVEVSVEPK